MINKNYKAIYVPLKLHYKIKKLALAKKVSMIIFLENLLSKPKV